METAFSIQQVAQQTELSIDTLRYYERIGLIEPVHRAANGHRRYGERDIAWIRLLIRLRETGMPIAQMIHFAQLRRQGAATATERRLILEEHQRALEQHMQRLEQHMAALQRKITSIRKIEAQRDAAPEIAPLSEQDEEEIAAPMLTTFVADTTPHNPDQGQTEIVTN
jgi:DNA-binding transcriptional MerR regulator